LSKDGTYLKGRFEVYMRCVAHLTRDQSEDIEDADTFWSSCACGSQTVGLLMMAGPDPICV
jgi:hypothetical protein